MNAKGAEKVPLRKLLTAFTDRLATCAFASGSRLFNLLPTATAYQLGVGLGRLWLGCDRRRRRIINRNLELALGLAPDTPEAAKLRRQIAAHLGCNLAEILLLHAGGPGARLLRRNMRIRGLERLHREVKRGRGVIIVSAHLGNWEMAGLLSEELGYEVATVGKPIKNKPRLYAAIAATREASGFRLLPKSGSAAALTRHLRRGGIIALLVDQRVRRKYRIFADFFGYCVPTSPAPATLARLSGSPILPVFTHRLAPLHHEIVIGEPLEPPRENDSRRTIALVTTRINRIIEAEIRAFPAQWFWPHDRWRRIKRARTKTGRTRPARKECARKSAPIEPPTETVEEPAPG